MSVRAKVRAFQHRKMQKTQAQRIVECVQILRKLEDIVSADNASIRVLKKRMGAYWRDGALQEDTFPLFGYDRFIVYRFPEAAAEKVEVTLRQASAEEITAHQLPSDLVEALTQRTRSASPPGPAHPSPQE